MEADGTKETDDSDYDFDYDANGDDSYDLNTSYFLSFLFHSF